MVPNKYIVVVVVVVVVNLYMSLKADRHGAPFAYNSNIQQPCFERLFTGAQLLAHENV